MPGLLHLYIPTAQTHIAAHVAANTQTSISRAEVELMLLRELDRSTLLLDWKLAWVFTILTGELFDSFWLSESLKYRLPASCTTRYIPDRNLLSYTAPANASSQPRSISPTPPRSSSPQAHAPPVPPTDNSVPHANGPWYGIGGEEDGEGFVEQIGEAKGEDGGWYENLDYGGEMMEEDVKESRMKTGRGGGAVPKKRRKRTEGVRARSKGTKRQH